MSDLLQLLAAREERVTLEGVELVVREVEAAADTAAFIEPGDFVWKLVVASTFDANGKPAFSYEQVPGLKAASKLKLAPLVAAVLRVNGRDIEAEAKNSEASQDSGSS